MKRRILFGAAAALVLGSGAPSWAQSEPGSGPPHMRMQGAEHRMGPGMMMPGMGHGMGPGMMHRMGSGMHGRMGPGMMGMGPGMMGMSHGSASASEMADIHDLFLDHDRIRRTVTNLPDGIRTLTESDDPQIAEVIKRHVAEMGKRVEQGRDPDLPIETPALRAIFRDKDKIKSAYEMTEKGVVVVQTSSDAETVKALQTHAAEVSDLARRGMPAAHEAMMRNMGGMMHGMHDRMGGRGTKR
jgi:hypothetical protein